MTISGLHNNIPFSEIFSKKENLIIIFSNDLAVNYRIVSRIIHWSRDCGKNADKDTVDNSTIPSESTFRSVYFLFPDFQMDFFSALLAKETVIVRKLSYKPEKQRSGIVINLNDDKKLLKEWATAGNNVIMGLGKHVNVKFKPTPTDPEVVIREVTGLLNLTLREKALNLENTRYNPSKINTATKTGKIVIAVNGFWKNKSLQRRIKNNTIGEFATEIVLCPTEKRWFFSPEVKLDLKQIIDQCYGTQSIITDDEQLKEVLLELGFQVSD